MENESMEMLVWALRHPKLYTLIQFKSVLLVAALIAMLKTIGVVVKSLYQSKGGKR